MGGEWRARPVLGTERGRLGRRRCNRHYGLLRQYFPRGTDLSRFSQAYLNRIALRLNQRPRKTLGFEAPADRLRAVLQ
jgi:IS30 family transposase